MCYMYHLSPEEKFWGSSIVKLLRAQLLYNIFKLNIFEYYENYQNVL